MKPCIVAGLVGAMCLPAWSLNKNQSIEFVQDLNRNASTRADAAFHNPAGLAFLPGDGLHLNLGNQIVWQDPSITESTPLLEAYGEHSYDGKVRIWALPSFDVVWRKSDLSLYLHGAPLSGGGEAAYDQGLPMFDNMALSFANSVGTATRNAVDAGYEQQLAAGGFPGQHVTSGSNMALQYDRDLAFTGDVMTLAGTVGAVYKILPTLSASVGYRFAYARNAYKASAEASKLGVTFQGSSGLPPAGISGPSVDSTLDAAANHAIDSLWRDIDLDVQQSGTAHGIILGLDFQPNDVWNVGLRLEWNGEMELENTSSSIAAPDALRPYLASFEKGAKTKATEPVYVAGGIAFKPIPDLTLESSAIFGFAEIVDHDGREDFYHNSLFAGLGARYWFTKRVEGALGYGYDLAFKEDEARTEADADLAGHYVSTGLGFLATPRLRIDGGALIGIMQDGQAWSGASGAKQALTSRTLTFGLGINWSPNI